MGGIQGPSDDGYDEDGYDESQRAEILEATRDGPSDGAILTDLLPDLGEDPDEDALEMLDDELGEEDDDAPVRSTASAEDSVQEDFDTDALEDDDDLDPADKASLEP